MRGENPLNYETEWSDDSLSLIFARYAKPIPPRPRPKPRTAWADTPQAKGRLAERAVQPAMNLACLVHGDGGPGEIADVINGLKPPQVRAMLVVLAAMVDVERTCDEVLGWIDWDVRGKAVCPSASAWKRHVRRGEDCPPCHAAAKALKVAKRAERKAAREAEAAA